MHMSHLNSLCDFTWRETFSFFFFNNKQIDKSGPVTQNVRGSKNMQKNSFLFVFFFSKMHFLKQIFQFSSGEMGRVEGRKGGGGYQRG